jgi:CBS-domain-containing membrane protein
VTYSNKVNKLTPWPESASEPYRPSDRYLSTKLVPAFADRGFHVVNVTDPYGRILGFLHRSRYFFLQVAPQLYSHRSRPTTSQKIG